MKQEGYIYMLTNTHKNVLYIGVTSDLKKHIYEHKNHIYKNSFTDRYNLEYLVYYEGFDNVEEAITREKTIKKWNRSKKDALIISANPNWKDLYDEVWNDVYSLLD